MNVSFRLNTFIHDKAPAPGEGVRLAIWQGTGTAATPAAVKENLERLEQVATLAAAQQVQLLAFPELYLSGYIVTPELAPVGGTGGWPEPATGCPGGADQPTGDRLPLPGASPRGR